MKICLVSSSGGHYEQLKMLKLLENEHQIFYVTEKTEYSKKSDTDYFLIQTGSKDRLFPVKMFLNMIKTFYIFLKEKPDYFVSTGAMVAIPFLIFSKIFKRKFIYIESFARVWDSSKTGRLMYKHADLFIVQWESLKEIYPNSVYGGSLY